MRNSTFHKYSIKIPQAQLFWQNPQHFLVEQHKVHTTQNIEWRCSRLFFLCTLATKVNSTTCWDMKYTSIPTYWKDTSMEDVLYECDVASTVDFFCLRHTRRLCLPCNCSHICLSASFKQGDIEMQNISIHLAEENVLTIKDIYLKLKKKQLKWMSGTGLDIVK